ncbi:hypothetical protein A1F99_061760 [Pyrenophora tritici-repentis]|nr:hypothetical protein A1F99_061760 [Pyrenophora tritici-repentis]
MTVFSLVTFLVSGSLVLRGKDNLATGEMRGHGPCLTWT